MSYPYWNTKQKEEWNKDEITAIMFKYQDCLFDWSGSLKASVGKEKDNLGNTGSQGGELAFPSGGQEPLSAKMGHSPAIKANPWRGEKGSMTGKGSI